MMNFYPCSFVLLLYIMNRLNDVNDKTSLRTADELNWIAVFGELGKKESRT